MNARFFLDTNIFVYANDASSPMKQKTARSLIQEAFDTRHGCLSTQILQEFFVVGTRKAGLNARNAREQVTRLGALHTVLIDTTLLLSAIDLHILHQLSFWDALVVKAASQASCAVLYSEDLNHGQLIDGVRVENPFRDID